MKLVFSIVWISASLLVAHTWAAEPNSGKNATEVKSDGQKETHWSLKPIMRPQVPALANAKLKPRNPVDHFVFAKLAKANLSPSPEADRRTLIRRLSFDLLGLPPTPAEVRAFEEDKAPDAYDKLVERLLNSEHYGERWARHWLDVVRFAETHGFEMNQPRSNAWQYRDYVIQAFNQDKPYDRFIMEQFVGDLFGEDAATGFLVGGAWDQVKSPDPVLTAAQRADELHDMVSTTGSAFLGLTVGCARCHNHKFDPIPQADYYAVKACLAGVQHGERKLNTPDAKARDEEVRALRGKLAQTEAKLEEFEPSAFTGEVLLLDTEPAFGSRLTHQLKGATRTAYAAGKSRGAREDPGGLARMPNFTPAYLSWTNSARTDVFAYVPRVTGRFHLWLSWGCGSDTHATDSRYVLDRDGDLITTNDQTEIASVNQQRFADGSGEIPNKSLWSGFYDAGVWDLSESNKIVLRGGATGNVTAGVLAVVEEQRVITSDVPRQQTTTENHSSAATVSTLTETQSKTPVAAPHFLRAAVNPRRNVERFAATKAKFLRFTITRTSDAEPCIDELEVYTSEAKPRNIALAKGGTTASASSVFPNSDIHRLEHINDGKLGNGRSWISNERGKGWVVLQFPEEATINRVVWGRDREEKFSDRVALDYRIEVSSNSNEWHLVASSRDRVPYISGRPVASGLSVSGLSQTQAQELKDLLAERVRLERRIKETKVPMVYAGTFMDRPDQVHRLQRGDPMQEREVVEPGVLSAISTDFHLDATRESKALGQEPTDKPSDSASVSESSAESAKQITPDQERRLALAKWISSPSNPLPARVMVNRLWQHHFGEGIVSTPSDFGKKGAEPTHPELLDWLASEFMQPSVKDQIKTPKANANAGSKQLRSSQTLDSVKSWSIKHIHRLIVTSATYRQASAARRDGMAVDAAARLLWRFPPQRLEAEPLRDTILAVSGKLDFHPCGPGYSPFEPNDNYVRVYNPKKEFGPGDWRRMVYMTKVRMQQDSTFGAFDCPDGGQIAPKRMRSTTPLQALNLLNSEFMVEQSGFFATRLKREAPKSEKAQIRHAFELAFNRAPNMQEAGAAEKFIAQHGLVMFCRAIFNSNEFIFVE